MKIKRYDSLFHIFNYSILGIASLSCLLPFLHILSVSLSSNHAILSGKVLLWPVEFSFGAYKELFIGTPIISAFQNSTIITIVGVFLSMMVTVMTAYPLSRKYFRGRKGLTLGIVFTMLFSGGLIPTFILAKNLGLLNSYWSLWLIGLVSAYNLLIMKTSFESIPPELEDASKIDGCGEFRFLINIVLPLSLPMLTTLSLFYGIHYWDLFMTVLIYINDTEKYNLAVMVQQMIQLFSLEDNVSMTNEKDIIPEMIQAASLIVMTLPMIIVYPFVQRFFVKGVMIGAIKG
ncbi:carbohydrate ABC transporter permease [Paenibacillus sp. PL2-23]|uniref:carbohydrate ABC transporter permease n=1 Tax=Paenibacillus sp. PL2-23 TaxID=2100729 RepID=UPI0030FB3C98